MKTRDRILRTALALFNESGEGGVSLAQIAAGLDISEGNLWYHFRTKRDLIAALLEELEQTIAEQFGRPQGDPGSISTYADYTRQCFRTMWAYRCLYRARFDPAKDRELAERRLAVTAQCHRYTERNISEMVRCKLLEVSPSEAAELAIADRIVSRYWFDYLQERYGQVQLSEADLQAGVRQIFALYQPYLSAAARAQIAAAMPQARSAPRPRLKNPG